MSSDIIRSALQNVADEISRRYDTSIPRCGQRATYTSVPLSQQGWLPPLRDLYNPPRTAHAGLFPLASTRYDTSISIALHLPSLAPGAADIAVAAGFVDAALGRGASWLKVAPTKHGHFPIKMGIDHGH